jgi:hypothetical protein
LDAKLNNDVLNVIAGEIEQTVFRSGKSIREIINIITTSHPEISLDQDWTQLNEKIRAAILERVKRTLESIR